MRSFMLGLVLATVIADDQITLTCPETTTINVPRDGIYYANATYAANQNCTYTLLFPEGTIVYIYLSVYGLTGHETASITDDFGDLAASNDRGGLLLHNYWPPSRVYINIVTAANTTNVVTISIWWPLPLPPSPPVIRAISINDPPVVITRLPIMTAFAYTSTSKVVLFCPENDIWSNVQAISINYFVYDGIGIESTLVGTFETFRNRPFVSSGNSLTIYNTDANGYSVDCRISDASNFPDLSNYNYYLSTEGYIYSDKSQRVLMDATELPAMITIFTTTTSSYVLDSNNTVVGPIITNYWPVLLGIDFSNTTSVMSVFECVPQIDMTPYKLFDYNSGNVNSRLPQAVQGTTLTLRLDSGIAYVTFKSSLSWSDWGTRDYPAYTVESGSSGYFFSDNYMKMNSATNTSKGNLGQASTNRVLNKYTISTQPGQFLSPESYLKLTPANIAGVLEMHKSLVFANPGASNFTIVAGGLLVEWWDGCLPTMGQMVGFKVEDVDGAADTTPAAPSTMTPAPWTSCTTSTTTTSPNDMVSSTNMPFTNAPKSVPTTTLIETTVIPTSVASSSIAPTTPLIHPTVKPSSVSLSSSAPNGIASSTKEPSSTTRSGCALGDGLVTITPLIIIMCFVK